MKLIIDTPVKRSDGKYWCHFAADNLDNLHRASKKIGLKREWFQNKPGKPHYDIYSPRLIEKAMKLGAIRVSPKQMIQYLKFWYETNESIHQNPLENEEKT